MSLVLKSSYTLKLGIFHSYNVYVAYIIEGILVKVPTYQLITNCIVWPSNSKHGRFPIFSVKSIRQNL